MLERRFSYLTIEWRDATSEIVLIPHSGNGPGVPKYTHKSPFTHAQIKQLTSDYWTEVWPIVWTTTDTLDVTSLENALAAIRGASASLAIDLFGAQTLQRIWRIARECQFLRIETNLLDVPWEALVNPFQDDDSFLAQLTTITRGYLFDDNVDRVFAPCDRPKNGVGIYLDTELEKKWREKKGPEAKQVTGLARRFPPVHLFRSIDRLIGDMKLRSIIGWICENEYDEKIGDRLRLADGVHCTRHVFLTKRLSQRALLCLVSCAEHNSDRLSEQIAADIAIQSGCTVIAPLIPLGELTGLRFLRAFVSYLSRFGSLGTKVTLADLLASEPFRNLVGKPSSLGVLLLFMGLYGSPDMELTDERIADA